MTAVVETNDLAAGYGGRVVLRGVSFAAEAGRMLSVLGPNGGGKTTLLRVLVGELTPVSGTARTAGRPAYLAQGERARLDFPVSALDVALMGALPGSRWWLPPRRSERTAARAALDRVGLAELAAERFGELSGGQRRRVLLARALVQEAGVVLLDEPLAGVDPVSAERMTALFRELRDEGRTLLVCTHDVESARAADLVLCVNRRQLGFGPPREVLDRSTLEATYGGEMVVLEGDGEPVRAVTVDHHEH